MTTKWISLWASESRGVKVQNNVQVLGKAGEKKTVTVELGFEEEQAGEQVGKEDLCKT